MNNYRILAEGKSISNNTFKTGLNNNDLIIGPSGAGKTGGYVIPNILQFNSSMIVADIKCNLYKKLSPALRMNGYDVHIVNFVDSKNSDSYNPLDYSPYDMDTTSFCEQDIVSIAHTLVPMLDSKDPFWENAARTVVACLIAYVLEAFDYEDRNLCTVLEVFKAIMCIPVEQNIEAGITFLEEWALKRPDSFAAKKYKMFKGIITTDKTWPCILQFVSAALDPFDFREARSIFCGQSDFRIEDLGRRKSVVFLNISDTDRSLDSLINIFYTQALQTLCREADKNHNSKLKVPVRIIMDDFATNAYVENFDKIISVIRSREISVSIILQSMTQLETMYSPSAAATIVNNCDHVLYLGGSDIKTAEYIAEKSCKSVESILCMELNKAYLLCRGKKGELVDKIKPYSMNISETAQGKDDVDGSDIEELDLDYNKVPFF